MKKIEEGKLKILNARIKASVESTSNGVIEEFAGGNPPLTGLQFDVKKGLPGEVLEIAFINNDIMPHNWVLVEPLKGQGRRGCLHDDHGS